MLRSNESIIFYNHLYIVYESIQIYTHVTIIEVFILFGEHSRELISPELCWLEFLGSVAVAGYCTTFWGRALMFGAGDKWGE